jgi:hypothetical protein
MTRSFQTLPLNVRIGEVIEVRSQQEILATLDRNGELDGLPFMPEMLQFCGRRFRVHRRAIKLCDTINWTGMHRMKNAVHLEGLRCDGQAHGGCQAGCLLLWKDAWLKRTESDADAQDPGHQVAQPTAMTVPDPTPRTGSSCTVDTLFATTRADGGTAAPGDETFSCQATELMRAAPARIPWWDLRQYLRDLRVGNAQVSAMIRYLTITLFNKFQAANRRFLPRLPFIHGARNYPFIDGRLTRTPKDVLNLRPGDLVEIRSKEEIVRTLDKDNKNRGLKFDIEMLRYCGQRARVLRRVDHIIDERTGKMMQFSNDCIILDGVVCQSEYYGFCSRSTYGYWREIWLKRVE